KKPRSVAVRTGLPARQMILQGFSERPGIRPWPGHPEGSRIIQMKSGATRPRRLSINTSEGGRTMKSLRNHIEENANIARGARDAPRRDREPAVDDELVLFIRSLGLDGATVSLPAGIDIETRAERMNNFWKELVRFQYDDVVVVALCSSKRR